MADTFVFHLMRRDATGLLRKDVVLRYPYDERIMVEQGDPWRLIAADGEVTDHRVAELRTLLSAQGSEELHAFMEPRYELEAQ
jgi:hypothetical protein